ncbi:single-stranded DNA-binding protein [Lewinella sp. 4G2]|uniref:single-stranded DNA-binding protein n=1 Tax=Lewinella sp. 4G2 TaxID=1803372 RepID=UPI0018D289B2|nr:single-stranded DNA-binding protein [Lewinella sp. 4G2]
MNSNNLINLVGRIGQEPQRRNFDNGGSLLELSLATNYVYKNRNGDRVTETSWHRLKTFQPKVVDLLEQYVSKGDQLSVVGRLQYRKWKDKYDQDRSTPEIIIEGFTFLSNGRDGGQRNQQSPLNQRNAAPVLNEPAAPAMQNTLPAEPVVLQEADGDGLPF